MRRLHRSQSRCIYLLTVPTEKALWGCCFFYPMEHDLVQITPHATHSAFLYGACSLTRPPRGGDKVFTYPSTYLGMHIYKNLTSFSGKETGNKQSSSPSHSRRDALSRDSGTGGQWVLPAGGWGEGVGNGVWGWELNGQQIEWPLKALRQTQGQPDSTVVLRLCSRVR